MPYTSTQLPVQIYRNSGQNIPRLPVFALAGLEWTITSQEMNLMIYKLKAGKVAGLDGFTSELYKAFRVQLI